MDGFHGCYWRFDLGLGEGERIPIPDSILRRTLGGVGLGTWLLHREAPRGVDPLAPEAPLVFAFSPLVGTPLTTSAKFAVVAKSPLSGGVSDALSSSHFAIAGKRLGVDAIVLVGACEEPSELVDGRLRPSRNWGCSARETAAALASFGRVAAIGVAGENRVRFASLSADGRHAGRGGLGAVMGSKRLKAIAVRGSIDTPIADPGRVERAASRLRRLVAGEATAKYRELGTVGNLLAFDRLGVLPTRNFQQGHFEGAEELSVERWHGSRARRRAACVSCTIGCEHRFEFGSISPGEGAEKRPAAAKRHPRGETRVEYESLFALGPLCGIADADVVLAAAHRCDELGLDTISAGATLAFAMECGERGLLEGGPSFGDAEGLLGWLEDIASRRGLGARLAEGSLRLAKSIGRDAIDFAPQVKGLELPGYEPRALETQALGFAVGTRGADHNRTGGYEIDLAEKNGPAPDATRAALDAIDTEDRAALLDSLILCKFVRAALRDFHADCAEMLSAVTGGTFSDEDLRRVARDVVLLRKAFNQREGWQPEDDTLPERFFREPIPSGPARGARLSRERLAAMIRSYNLARGWHADGTLPEALLADLADRFGLGPDRKCAVASDAAKSFSLSTS
ncbi:MAG TPA: aldehyde:ferredoxin oxidoreductase, partial [Deltaproteobacteria bacterium]|nr:aldehyde:ferredoxin oxidoreductase [Deltaproteobacteria bacterium]